MSRVATLLILAAVSSVALAQDKYADFNGIKIRYVDRGKGEPIVLLHGGTSNLESWVKGGGFPRFGRRWRFAAWLMIIEL